MRLLVCDTGLYLEPNDISFITVAICGGYISKYPRLYWGICVTRSQWVNSSPPSAAYMRQWTGSSLVQVMACRLFGAKPLPEPMLTYCELDSWEHISVKFESEFYHFHSGKCSWKCRLSKCRPFCAGGDEWSATLHLVPGYVPWEITTRMILGLHPTNERRRYYVNPSLIGWAQT